MAPDEREDFERLRDIARSLTTADRNRLEPPPELWTGIAERLDADRRDDDVVAFGPAAVRAGRTTRWFLGAAAAVAVAIALVAGLALLLGGDTDDADVIASGSITNDGLPVAFDGSGAVELVSDDGRLALTVDVPELPESDGFYELWVIDTDVEGMQSLGIVTGSGTFPLPNGIDPADFPVIDISVEPADGDPTHSGRSVLRGILEV